MAKKRRSTIVPQNDKLEVPDLNQTRDRTYYHIKFPDGTVVNWHTTINKARSE